ncbi:Melibiose operon regulatory protein [Gimesia chilikensis]|uniref:Melibiose operon regulatory protein n=1 Tax=Gimesia chilikensis TaxID=2605989 RepID=A0A517WFX1_9PLAN|nr:AraC family transcriptional regulator [Gimesia chilikensis]KAA0141475.1 AraC family transcriptional regulator [Gimesia chilikensis]QDU04158.1 Melibiose operon regulatory protein [Gimesia chilikensis]
MQDPQKFRDDFLKRLDNKLHLEELFNYIPDAYFFAKDAQGRFINISRAWMDVRAIPREEDIIGKTDFDIHPQDLAEQYVAEDQRVMESATPLPNQVWLIPDRQGNLKWYLCSKIPLFGDGGKVIGVAGVLRDIKVAGSEFQSYQELDQVIAYVLEHYQERIQISELADLIFLSVSQLDRKFKKLYQITPQKYILRVRINAACQLLTRTEKRVSEIALESGFYDQSYFTKQFVNLMGLSPSEYRKRFRQETEMA